MLKSKVEVLENYTDKITKEEMEKGMEVIYDKERASELANYKLGNNPFPLVKIIEDVIVEDEPIVVNPNDIIDSAGNIKDDEAISVVAPDVIVEVQEGKAEVQEGKAEVQEGKAEVQEGKEKKNNKK